MTRKPSLPAPSRSDVLAMLDGLIDGSTTCVEASAWAWQWVGADDPGVADPSAWRALNALAGVDSPTTDREYLCEREDFVAWRDELDAADD